MIIRATSMRGRIVSIHGPNPLIFGVRLPSGTVVYRYAGELSVEKK